MTQLHLVHFLGGLRFDIRNCSHCVNMLSVTIYLVDGKSLSNELGCASNPSKKVYSILHNERQDTELARAI